MKKPNLLILHGWGCDKYVYCDVVAHLEPRYSVTLPELPGFGDTPEPPEPWGVSEYADYVLELCKREDILPDIVIAHSLGARIAIKLLAEDKITPRKIVFTGAAGIRPKQTLKQKIKTRLFKFKKALLRLSPEALEKLRQKHGSADYREASPMMRQCLVKIVNEDLTELLPLIEQETLLIWGEDDDATPLADGYLMEKLMPDAGLALMRETGHYAFIDQPELFNRILDSYLEV
jgi:pimeloyl-ACP methyl ester carboxylesterase